MNVLAFDSGKTFAGRRIRQARFVSRSSLPVSAACVVANGVRETLAALLGTHVSLRLLEPVIPNPQAWGSISAGAQLYEVRGKTANGAFVLRPADALGLAAAAFGENCGECRALSPVEQEVLGRALRAIAGALAPVLGRELAPLERILDIGGYVTYFEMLVEEPARFRIGVALSRDPHPAPAAILTPADLYDVRIDASVTFAAGFMDAADFLALRPGTIVPMMTKVGEPGLLRTGGAVLARGECGALGERAAMIVSAAP